MTEHLRARLPISAIVATAIAAAAIVLVALVVLSRKYPLPIIIGAWPVPLFAGLTLSVALATAAVATDPASRHPSLSMPLTE
jgi:uncharacterized membrane protein